MTLVLTHDELSALSDQELKQQLPHLKVVSRALPMDKNVLLRQLKTSIWLLV